jgi:HTH-type transcriptional regulator, sugar sensing transcriptional regulator
MKEIEQLQELGLTEGESKVYFALLHLGSSTVGPIVKRSKLAYSKIYEVLERLQEKGLVSIIMKSQVRHYQAVPPKRIEEYLKKKEEKVKEERDALKKLIPQLELLQEYALQKAEAEVFIGWKGMYAAEQKLIEGATKKDNLLFLYVEERNERADQFFASISHFYTERGMTLRGIGTKEYKKSPFIKNAKHIKLRSVDYPVPSNIDICRDKVIIASWKQPIAILITNREIADHFRAFFEEVWKQAKT